MINAVALGAIAGAVGTLALDISTYTDIAVRGRGSSDVPAIVVDKLAQKASIASLSSEHDSEAKKNRREGAGALMGYGVGLSLGTAYGIVRPRMRAVPWPIMGVLLGLAAMAASDVPATRLEATNPKTWSVSSWVADLVPHVVYGLSSALAFEALSSEKH